MDLFVEPVKRPPQLLVLGTSAVAQALANHATLLGYAVTMMAPAKKAPAGLAKGIAYVGSLAASKAPALREEDYAVVATQGQRDLDALQLALASKAEYVALVASIKKSKHLLGRIDREKLPARRIKRLKYPAGLDIKGVEPAEIAVSILAEIIERRRRPAE